MVTEIGFVSNETPEVLRNPSKSLPQRFEFGTSLPEAQALNLEVEHERIV
jgi:hypothetical protein